jgi:prepilin-type N-terminal cleavage/methylation domain-containing protein
MPKRFPTTNRERGFTLAEILVTTAIFAIIMIAALTVYDRSNQVFSSSSAAANLQQSTRIGFEKLVSDLRMTGFDYNRGGIPNGQGQFPQPDEQIEYAGPTSIVIRSNFDYNIHPERGNGLAPDGTGGTPNYYVTNGAGLKVFPYITTDNTEIIAYVLRSTAPGAANSNSISFYADTDIPRHAYPNVSGMTSNGHAENRVTISGIDTSNNNPPYTLYRVTVDDITNNRPGTPVAENIRSLNFTYYNDGVGSTVLQLPGSPPTDITQTRNAGGSSSATSNTGAIGGDGQYDPNASNGIGAGTFTDRNVRTLIQSVRVAVVGMDATPTPNYQNPTETNTTYKNYREYSLSSLIVPRNLGLQGFPEPNFNTPGPPAITGVCVGHCAAPFITWTPPSGGGPVTVGYKIEWDTSTGGSFSDPNTMVVYDPAATSAQLKDCGCDPSGNYVFQIVAINDNGEGPPSNQWWVRPQNSTQPSPPSGLSATTAQANQITLAWTAPSTNAVTTMSCAGAASTSGSSIPSAETIHFQVARSTNPSFTPTTADLVLDFDTISQPTAVPGGPVTWVDGPGVGSVVQSIHPPAACVQYYYRVRALDRCYKGSSMNVSGAVTGSQSTWFPATGQPGWPGQAVSSSTPTTPALMALDPDPSKTQCPKANGLCNIALNWNKVVTDTNGNAVAVDTYTLFRERRLQGTSTWAPDTTNGSNGQRDIPGFSSQTGSPVSFIDTNIAYQDPINGLYEYRYSVAAKICTNPSPAFSNTAIYPGCNFSVTLAAPGASSGSGSFADPWVLGYGDSVTVTRNAGNQLASISFQLMQNGTNVGSPLTTTGTGPFTYPWTDQPGGYTYELWIRMTDSAGCSMTYVRYINQQSPAPCTFQDLGTTGRPGPPTPSLGTSGSQPRSVTFDFAYNALASANFALTNNQPSVATSETMKFNVLAASPGGPFNGSMTLVWADVNGLHPELKLVSVDWIPISAAGSAGVTYTTTVNQALTFTTLSSAISATQTTLTVASATTLGAVGTTGVAYIDSEALSYTVTNATTLTVTRGVLGTTAATHALAAEVEKQMTNVVNAPTLFPDILPGQSIEFILHMTYDSSHKNTKLTTSGTAIRNICVKYKVASDPTLTQACNLVGRLATSANPSSCD